MAVKWPSMYNGQSRESPGEPNTICKRQPSIKEAKMKIDIVNKKKIKVNILKVEVWKAKVTPIPLPTKKMKLKVKVWAKILKYKKKISLGKMNDLVEKRHVVGNSLYFIQIMF